MRIKLKFKEDAMKLTNKDMKFHLFILCQSLLTFSSSAYGMALLFYIQDKVDSVLMNGIIGNVSIVSGVTLTLFIGTIIDRSNKWVVMFWSSLVLTVLGWIPGILDGLMSVVWLFIFILIIDFIISLADEFDIVSKNAYIDQMVEDKYISSMFKYLNSAITITGIAGFLFVLLTIDFIPFYAYFFIASIIYLFCLIIIIFLPKDSYKDNSEQAKTNTLKDIVLGLKYVMKSTFQKYALGISIGFIARNQVVMSLLVFYIGVIDPGFKNIYVIAFGYLIGVTFGFLFNFLPWQSHFILVPIIIIITGSVSTFSTIFIGLNITQHLPPIFIGIVMGLIFGMGIAPQTIIDTYRMRGTESVFQGRGLALRRMLGGIFSFVLIFVFGLISELLGHIGIPFIFAGVLYGVNIIIFIYGILTGKLNIEIPKENKKAESSIS